MATRSTSSGGIDANAALRSAVTGAGAFVATYVVTFVVWSLAELPEPDTFEEAFQQAIVEFVRDSVPTWKSAGYVQFNAHAVDLTYETAIGDGAIDLIALADGSLLTLVYVLPPLLLVVGGYLVASNAGVDGVGQAAALGALQLIGYGILAAVLAILVAHDTGGTALSVDIPSVVVFAGIVYPVVCGGIGGAIADLT
jgi:hypothetical protein